jgi:hypothetical protein
MLKTASHGTNPVLLRVEHCCSKMAVQVLVRKQFEYMQNCLRI